MDEMVLGMLGMLVYGYGFRAENYEVLVFGGEVWFANCRPHSATVGWLWVIFNTARGCDTNISSSSSS
jgi:hypothetical protein